MPSIAAIDISTWSDRMIGRSDFSELIQKLISTTIAPQNIRCFRMPTREAGGLSGYDGLLECDSGIVEIPWGRSVWELGTEGDARSKIKGDWEKRLDKPNLPEGWAPQEVTFVAVVSRNISNPESYRTKLKKYPNNQFKDLLILDAVALEAWIARCPSVDAWLRDEHNVGHPIDLKSLIHESADWLKITDPIISPDLVLAGREKEISSLAEKLQQETPGILSVLADSPEEAVSFIASTFKRMSMQENHESQFWKTCIDRAVVCQKSEAVRHLPSHHPLVMILHGEAINQANVLVRANHTVMTIPGHSTPGKKPDISLSRPKRTVFAEALIKAMNYKTHEAEIDAKACGASVSVWRIWNLLRTAHIDQTTIPEWARQQEFIDVVVPAVFLGGWDEKNPADTEIINTLSKLPFLTLRDKISPFAVCHTPLINKAGSVTTISGVATAFSLIVGIGWVNKGHLERLALEVGIVFAEIDPMIDMPPDERHMAGIRDKRLSHSTWLRHGLAETLLRIVVLGDKLEQTGVVPGGSTCQQFVDQLIRNLPGLNQDWRLMVSLRDQLPVLMEAAPRPFIEALETLLQGDGNDVGILFQDGEAWMGHSLRPGLLWGLETLAWEPAYLARVVLILARLHTHDPDPESNMVCRPINSLWDIFLAWYPGTSATVEQRLAALDALEGQFPDIAWTLLCKLLPSPHQMTSDTHAPQWCDFGRSQQQPLTHAVMGAAYDGYIQRTIQLGRGCPDRLCFLLERSEDMPERFRLEVVNALDELEATESDSETRKMVSTALRNLVGNHTQFNGAAWAMPEEDLKPIRERLERWTVQTTRFDWLFNDWLPPSILPVATNTKPLDAITQLRSNAVNELWRQEQWPVVNELIRRVSYPGLVAAFVVEQLTTAEEGRAIIRDLADDSLAGKIFASDFSSRMLNRFGPAWLALLDSEKACQSWSPDYWVSLCRYFPDNQLHMDWIASLGQEVDTAYWQEKLPYIDRESNLDPEWVVSKYLSAGRSWRAMSYVAHNLGSLPRDRVMDVLQECLKSDPTHDAVHGVAHEVDQIVAWLRQQENIDKFRLMSLEYNFLPWLARPGMRGEPLALHRGLANDPELFVQVICDVFKARSAPRDDEEPTPEKRHRAKLGWDLLSSWRTPPGVAEDGQVDEKHLTAWVNRARELANEHDRLIVAEQKIGNVLSYFPKDPDDSVWPHQALRRLLENVASEEMERGIEIGNYNSIGAQWRDMSEGGTQERLRAAEWRQQAEAIGPRWPRTQTLLNKMADGWENQAKQQDTRAQQERLRDQ